MAGGLTQLFQETITEQRAMLGERSHRRELSMSLLPNKVHTVIGVRRGGKSTLVYQHLAELAHADGPESIVAVDFFDERLVALAAADLGAILEAAEALHPNKAKAKRHYFFDEIQEIEGWEPFVSRVLRRKEGYVFVSGSSAKMLSAEIATQLRGRAVTWELFPFSFREFCTARGADHSGSSVESRVQMEQLLEHYLQCGGFPEVLEAESKERHLIHQSYFRTILARDVIERIDAASPQAVVELGRRLFHQTGCLVTQNRLIEQLRSNGYKISKESLTDYLNALIDAYLLFMVELYDPSAQRRAINPKKVYAIDHGMARSTNGQIKSDEGRLLETAVFIELRRRSSEVYYHRNQDNTEVDFVVIRSDGHRELFQVTLSIDNPETAHQEIHALTTAQKELIPHRALLVVQNLPRHSELRVFEQTWPDIEFIPAWKFFVEALQVE